MDTDQDALGAEEGGMHRQWEVNFRTHMKRLREKDGMTQTELARRLKALYGLPFHQQTIQRIESGERPIRVNEGYLIADTFGVSLDSMTQVGASDEAELRWVTERLEHVAALASADLLDLRDTWDARVTDWAFALFERLKERTGIAFVDLDEVTKWGLMWATWVAPVAEAFTEAQRLMEAVGEVSPEPDRSGMWGDIAEWAAWVHREVGPDLPALPDRLKFPEVRTNGEHSEAP